jgi:5'-methylthioadenosine phosphorylase
MLGIIGGTGIYSLGKMEREEIRTPYGKVVAYSGKIRGGDALFIPRHGEEHGTPPHRVDYKANIWVMKEKGVEGIVAFYASGVIAKYKPGDLVLLEDFIGFYSPVTYYEDFREGIRHADMSEPYSRKLSALVKQRAAEAGVRLRKGGIIATTTGPRFETRAEIRALEGMGANLVNMTSAYEAALAGELGIPLCGIAVATNYAAGIKGKKELTHQDVLEHMEGANGKVKKVVEAAVGK